MQKLKLPDNTENNIDIKAIVSPNQEYIDIDPDEFKGIKDRTEKRSKRPKEKGLLLIYPLNPNVPVFKNLDVSFSENLVPIGIALSFPDTDIR